MAISKSLLKRVEEGWKNANSSFFKKASPFPFRMEEWFNSGSNKDF
jgi:hypothetical protein